MNTVAKIIGYFSIIPMLLGALFKIQHWPGAGLMLILGNTLFAIAFMPSYFVYRYQTRESEWDIAEGAALMFTGMILSTGMLFKIQHWPGSGAMLIIGTVTLVTLIPIFITNTVKKNNHKKGWNILGLFTILALVFMGWALKSSKSILDVFTTQSKSFESLALVIDQRNTAFVTNFNSGNSSSLQAQQIHSTTQSVQAHIQFLKQYLAQRCSGLQYDPTIVLDPLHVGAKDNYDIPTNILIGNDPYYLTSDETSAQYLREILENYKHGLLASLGTETGPEQDQIDSLFNFRTVNNYGYEESWEIQLFYYVPYVAVISTLCWLEFKVVLAESIALDALHEKRIEE